MPDYRVLIGVGGGLVVLGAVLPFLMVLRILPSTFFLPFFRMPLRFPDSF